ncbi:MAG: hypothetical protein HHJ11_19215, partial [Phycicoccus sp.]|nr:hypothetical protein [Phycicoccus sp.]
MPANDRMPCLWSRRSLLVALTVGSMTALSGCSVRLTDDVPRTPTPPPRQPMPDEQALLTARRDAVRLRDLAASIGGAATATTELLTTKLLATVHGLQAEVFESALRSGGVPPVEIAGTPTTTPPTQAAAGIGELIAAEGEALSAQALSVLARISVERVALFGSMTAQRAAAVRLLGGRLPVAGPLTAPTGELAAALLEAIPSAVYG